MVFTDQGLKRIRFFQDKKIVFRCIYGDPYTGRNTPTRLRFKDWVWDSVFWGLEFRASAPN